MQPVHSIHEAQGGSITCSRSNQEHFTLLFPSHPCLSKGLRANIVSSVVALLLPVEMLTTFVGRAEGSLVPRGQQYRI